MMGQDFDEGRDGLLLSGRLGSNIASMISVFLVIISD